MSAAREPRLRIRGLHRAFGAKNVLRGVDIDVGAGESVVIIGGSGTGKSVTLKCALGIVEPDRGSILVDGVESVGLKGKAREAVNARMGVLFQGGALFDSLAVWENVAFGLVASGRKTRREAKPVALETLAQVGLGRDVGALMPAELSGGMQKRVALARAIASRPDILFFDEPTTGLDPIMADVINDLIVECVRKLGATALSITHDMASARKIADRIAMLHEGRIVWSGAVSEIDRSGNAYVDQFIHGRASGPIRMAVRR